MRDLDQTTSRARRLAAVAALCLIAGCAGREGDPPASEPPAQWDGGGKLDWGADTDEGPTMPPYEAGWAPPPAARPLPPPTHVAAAGAPRVVAIGDVHGDLAVTRALLMDVGVMDDADNWIAGAAVVVQVGDQLDRGDGEQAILELFEALADQAHAAGGAFYSLLGNHETMNVEQDFRYVTDGGWEDFAWVPPAPDDPLVAAVDSEVFVGRVAAFRPGGPWALLLARHNVVMSVDGTVFVHGGVLPEHLAHGLERLNAETQAWLRGAGDEPAILQGADAPVWTRAYSEDPDDESCARLAEVLAALGAERMIVGHTPFVAEGITPLCDGRVWCIDVGMAGYYGGTAAALEISDGQLWVW